MLDLGVFDHSTLFFQPFDDKFVGVFHVNSLVVRNLFRVTTGWINWAHSFTVFRDNTFPHATSEIVFSGIGCLVNDTGTRAFGDVSVTDDLEGTTFSKVSEVLE
jgi:hypothetical protein